MIRTVPFALLVAVAGPALAAPAFFIEAVPLWVAGLPLLAGIWAGTRLARAAAMLGWLALPAAISAIGLSGIGHDPVLVWGGAALVVVALACLPALFGILLTSFGVTLVPFFPASPFIPLADVLPAVGVPALLIVALCLACIELLPRHRGKALLALVGVLAAVNGAGWEPGRAPPSAWAEVPEPPGLTDNGRRLAILDVLPDGGAAVLGEAVFRADDMAALAAWCRAAEARDLTLFVGVTETLDGSLPGATGWFDETDRGAVWQLDREGCAPGGSPTVVARAWLGIPGVTGDFVAMPGRYGDWIPALLKNGEWLRGPWEDDTWTAPEFLVCLEGFLPWAWLSLWLSLSPGGGDVVVISNDEAFGKIPVHVLRRKATGAMASLLKRGIAHAETGRTVLVRGQGGFDR